MYKYSSRAAAAAAIAAHSERTQRFADAAAVVHHSMAAVLPCGHAGVQGDAHHKRLGDQNLNERFRLTE